MTDKTNTTLSTLIEAEAGLRDMLTRLTKRMGEQKDTEPLDKCPRAFSATLKALNEVVTQREAIEAKAKAEKYTRWEDLPPPSPEDEARYYEDFKRIYHAVAFDK